MSRDDRDLYRVLRWYPAAWRERYGDEFIALLEETSEGRQPTRATRISLAIAGLRQRARTAGLSDDTASPRDRRRSSTLVILVAWGLFVLAGCAFAKLSEHADTAVSASARWRVLASYRIVEGLAIVAGCAVVAGILVCGRPFISYLRSGGWPAVRPPIVLAVAITCVAGGGTVALATWAHRLAPAARETGAWPYGPAFVAWTITVAAAIVAWTVAAVVVASRIDIPDDRLRGEVLLSRVVVIAMLGMTIAFAIWWAAVSESAPAFIGSQLDLMMLFAAMVLADMIATTGAVRGACTGSGSVGAAESRTSRQRSRRRMMPEKHDDQGKCPGQVVSEGGLEPPRELVSH